MTRRARMLLQEIVVGPIRCAPEASGDYRIYLQMDPSVLLNATNASPYGLAFARGSCGARYGAWAKAIAIELCVALAA